MKIEWKQSRFLLAYLMLIHTAAVLLVNMLGLSLMLTVPLSLLVIASLLFYCRRYGRHARTTASGQLWVDADGFWFWSDLDGRKQGPMLLKASVILGPVIAIYLKASQKRFSHSLLIVRDAVTAEDWRRLRVRLRDPESWE